MAESDHLLIGWKRTMQLPGYDDGHVLIFIQNVYGVATKHIREFALTQFSR